MQQQRDHSIRSIKSQQLKHSESFYQKHKLIKEWSQPRSNIVDQPSRSESRNNDNLQSMEDHKKFLQNRYKEKQARIQEYQCQINKLQKKILEKDNQIILITDGLQPQLTKRQELEEKIQQFESFENQQEQELQKLEKMEWTQEIQLRIENTKALIAGFRRKIKGLKYNIQMKNVTIQNDEDYISYLKLDKRGFYQRINSIRSAIDLQIKTLHEIRKQLSRM